MPPARILDGTALARDWRMRVGARVDALVVRGIRPRLDVIIVGDDAASQVYVRNKTRASTEVGITSEVHRLEGPADEPRLLGLIDTLNRDPAVHGILVQLPLPGHIASHKAIAAIDPSKDVDGFHPLNVGALMLGDPAFVPCTPSGVIALLESNGVPIAGQRAVVVGRSNIVGKPVAMLFLQRDATVTICHSKTRDLGTITREADILVVATGRQAPDMRAVIDGSMVKRGAAIVDVGINRMADGRLAGDIDFASCSAVAGCITPVPGGVGPMTVAMLLDNTVTAAERRHG